MGSQQPNTRHRDQAGNASRTGVRAANSAINSADRQRPTAPGPAPSPSSIGMTAPAVNAWTTRPASDAHISNSSDGSYDWSRDSNSMGDLSWSPAQLLDEIDDEDADASNDATFGAGSGGALDLGFLDSNGPGMDGDVLGHASSTMPFALESSSGFES